jgi:hypothetical protein
MASIYSIRLRGRGSVFDGVGFSFSGLALLGIAGNDLEVELASVFLEIP